MQKIKDLLSRLIISFTLAFFGMIGMLKQVNVDFEVFVICFIMFALGYISLLYAIVRIDEYGKEPRVEVY